MLLVFALQTLTIRQLTQPQHSHAACRPGLRPSHGRSHLLQAGASSAAHSHVAGAHRKGAQRECGRGKVRE